MKLSTSPYLVQKEILDNMKTSNLLLLSFVSRNMKKLIKSSQIERFKNISHIMYKNRRFGPKVTVPGKYSLDTIMEFTESRKKTKNNYFQLNVSGKVIDFRLFKNCNYPEASFHPSDKESVIETIHNYFLDFFGDTVEYQWETYYDEKFIPNLPNLTLSISVGRVYFEITELEDLESFFASSPIFNHVESVRLMLYSNTVPIFLRHFQGRQAFLRCNECAILDLIEFINRWKSGEEYQMLEHLIIILLSNGIPQNQILNANVVKLIDATKTPPTHTLPKVLKSAYSLSTDPITSHSYVVRETDNRVASVSVQGKSFCFGVWKETEEEFLRMVT
ncbi:hypothetical protein B9Z55_009629 [Caenorhabditis nigoni]|uniref:F-box domain-containing protein n=1 Tax=Caenorhabditis nigoni TaxID=1611254 RepID=A0A2G5USU7_9PELO|nr:hypothetical protein B9Z55_009629 [Caenorhabditis nigoni]